MYASRSEQGATFSKPQLTGELRRFSPLLRSVSLHCFKLVDTYIFIGKNNIFTLFAYAATKRWIANAKTSGVLIFTTAEFL